MKELDIDIPMVIEQTAKGERSYDIYSRLLLDRIVYVSGLINGDVANAVVAQLLFLQSQDAKKEISIYINTPGGDPSACLAIYDAIKFVKCPVATYCLGQTASFGVVLLAAGTKGRRFALPNARIMIDQPWNKTKGKASDIEIVAKEMLRLKKVMNERLAENMGKSVREIDELTDRDCYMGAEEARKLGLVDEVLVTSRK